MFCMDFYLFLLRMEMKASDLEEENQKLRGAVASVPYVRLPSNVNRDDPDLEVPEITLMNFDAQF